MSADLVAFLRARLDEDERACRFAMWDGEGPWTEVSSGVLQTAGDLYPTGNQGVSRYAVHFQPMRMLREVEANRLVVDEVEYWTEKIQTSPDYPGIVDRFDIAYGIGKLLALPYADHPDFFAEWDTREQRAVIAAEGT